MKILIALIAVILLASCNDTKPSPSIEAPDYWVGSSMAFEEAYAHVVEEIGEAETILDYPVPEAPPEGTEAYMWSCFYFDRNLVVVIRQNKGENFAYVSSVTPIMVSTGPDLEPEAPEGEG